MEEFIKDNFKIIFVGIIFLVTVTSSTYIYTQNTGYKGCLNEYAKTMGYKNWNDRNKKKEGVEKQVYGAEFYSIKKFCGENYN